MSTATHRAALLAATLLAGLTLTACGSDDPGSGSDAAAADHDTADVTFATQMVPHHAQAVEMAELVDGKDVDPAVTRLAADIEAAQAPEIETMTSWLQDWDEPVPDTADHDMSGDDMSGMPGMMTEDDLAELADADGSRFQTMWLRMMVEHHQGAVDMATTEQEDGEYPDAVDLAEDIEKTQTREIAVMQRLLRAS